MGEPINNKTLGGVSYNANQFTGKDLGNGQFELKAKHGGESLIFGQQSKIQYYGYSDGSRANDPREHKLVLKNGANGAYHVEENARLMETNPRIEMKTDEGWFVDDNNFTIADMMGATFHASEETVANVKLENSSNVTLELGTNASKYYGDHAEIIGGENNEVVLDGKDSARINGKFVEGRGIAAQKDYIE